MTIQEYNLFADFYRNIIEEENVNKSEEAFIKLSLDLLKNENDPDKYNEIFNKLLSVIDGDEEEQLQSVLNYIVDTEINNDDGKLSELIGKLPAFCCEPLLNIIKNNTPDTEDINYNKILLRFIESQDKATTQDFEQKVKTIIRFSENALQKKKSEIKVLQDNLLEPQVVLDKIKRPLSDLETMITKYIRNNRNKEDAHRLIQIDQDLRGFLYELFDIDSCIPFTQWASQEKIIYNPEVHQLTDKPEETDTPIMVHILSPGFILQKQNQDSIIMRALVSVNEESDRETGHSTKKKRDTKRKEDTLEAERGNID